MVSTAKAANAPLLVTGHLDINGSVPNDAIVQGEGSLHVRGNIVGGLTIEKGANVVVEGHVDGKIINRGGRLVVNNNTLAGLVRVDGPPEDEAGGILRINLLAVALNWSALARRTQAECAAVVKADGYGCGIDLVTSALARSGCKTFFVSDLAEAKRVRAATAEAAIYVLNGLYPGTGPAFADINAQPVIGSLAEIAEWDVFVASSRWTGGFALYVNTGMNRLGISVEEAVALAIRINSANPGITLLMSDLDHAQSRNPAHVERQITLFRELHWIYRGIPASLADASDIFSIPESHFDLVRPGAALYGVNPTPGSSNPMLPVIELQARIVQVRNLARGETLAYGAGRAVKGPRRIALVSAGYADGYPRSESASDHSLRAIVGGNLCPLAGGVSMDLLAIDVTDLADPRAAQRGEMVTLIGGEIGIDDLAAAAKSSGYEVLANLRRRFHNVYYAN